MGSSCPQCGSHHLRFSRVRMNDLLYLAILQVPVRCVECQERSSVLPLRAIQLWLHRRARRRRMGQHSKTV